MLQSVRSSNASLNKAPYSMQAAMIYPRSLILYANLSVSILLQSQGVGQAHLKSNAAWSNWKSILMLSLAGGLTELLPKRAMPAPLRAVKPSKGLASVLAIASTFSVPTLQHAHMHKSLLFGRGTTDVCSATYTMLYA